MEGTRDDLVEENGVEFVSDPHDQDGACNAFPNLGPGSRLLGSFQHPASIVGVQRSDGPEVHLPLLDPPCQTPFTGIFNLGVSVYYKLLL